MNTANDIPHLIALVHSSKLRVERINALLIEIIHEKQLSLEDFFLKPESDWISDFHSDEKTLVGLRAAKAEIPNSSFIAEDLLAQGFEVIPLYSADYPKTLKDNLKARHSPPVIYIKGNKQIFQEDSIAIVGSRDASAISLQFTDALAKKATGEYKVIVSGFAKGIDQAALESALKYKGRSIVVLPQGILTFGSGIRRYYTQIVEGDVVILSTFFPKAPWSVQLAMGRNPYIYGLARNIFVAESGNSGGTWTGVIDGLRKGRIIYVRKPEEGETNANQALIDKGAVAVDLSANVIEAEQKADPDPSPEIFVQAIPEEPKVKAKTGKGKKNTVQDPQAEFDFSDS